MDAKDLRTETTLGDRSNDGSSKFVQSVAALPCNSNKTYEVLSTNPLAKVEAPTSRPCAVIGPDRIVPPPSAADAYLKKGHYEPWPPMDTTYRQPPEYPNKMPNYLSPLGNISPRQTFQENMPRIMVQPTYNSKVNEDANYALDRNLSKNNKINGSSDPKYCDVPYTVSQISSDHKTAEMCVPNVNNARNGTYPQMWHPSGVNVRPARSYGAPDLYQYPDFASCSGPRSSMPRPHRTINEDPGHVYADTYYHDSSIRYKPYPTIKERYPQARYEYVSNYPNSFHPPHPFPPYKYDIQKPLPPHPAHSQVPIKYVDNRMSDPVLDGYQRPTQGPYPTPYRNQMIHHPAYGPMIGNNLPNKIYPYPPEGPVKPVTSNKLPYDSKLYIDYDTARNKGFPISENFYDMRQHMKNQVIIPNYPPANVQPIHPHSYYRKENLAAKNYEYLSHLRHLDPSVNPNALTKLSSQFSPGSIAISPSDSNTSNDTAHTQGGSLEDCGYVSQSSTASLRSVDSGNNRIIPNDFHRRYHYAYPAVRTSPLTKQEMNGNANTKNKKGIDVRQFLQMWNEGDEESASNAKDPVPQPDYNNQSKSAAQYEAAKTNEQLYVLGLMNVPSEELGKYEHIQKVSKLPENIKGYNNIELLKHFEEAIESSNISHSNQKQPIARNYPLPAKHSLLQALPPRPLSPLDVEAKISQSVIHKEVGCNFEIKPCSPEMLNVEVAKPAQTIINERTIEKVTNPIKPQISNINENEGMCKVLNQQEHTLVLDESNKIPSCKMVNIQCSNNDTTNTIKSNYSLQDLESNSGVCLASLPRLDNDIELNFPEVNQQFINANKESVITTTDAGIKANNINFQLNESDDLETASKLISSETEKEFSKLSKYRKIKRNDSVSKEKLFHLNSQSLRTDSVIIKNPENAKILEHTEITSNNKKKEEELQDVTMSSNCYLRDRDNKVKEEKFSSEIAIDFSLHKIENCKPAENHQIESNVNTHENAFDVNTPKFDNSAPEHNITTSSLLPVVNSEEHTFKENDINKIISNEKECKNSPDNKIVKLVNNNITNDSQNIRCQVNVMNPNINTQNSDIKLHNFNFPGGSYEPSNNNDSSPGVLSDASKNNDTNFEPSKNEFSLPDVCEYAQSDKVLMSGKDQLTLSCESYEHPAKNLDSEIHGENVIQNSLDGNTSEMDTKNDETLTLTEDCYSLDLNRDFVENNKHTPSPTQEIKSLHSIQDNDSNLSLETDCTQLHANDTTDEKNQLSAYQQNKGSENPNCFKEYRDKAQINNNDLNIVTESNCLILKVDKDSNKNNSNVEMQCGEVTILKPESENNSKTFENINQHSLQTYEDCEENNESRSCRSPLLKSLNTCGDTDQTKIIPSSENSFSNIETENDSNTENNSTSPVKTNLSSTDVRSDSEENNNTNILEMHENCKDNNYFSNEIQSEENSILNCLDLYGSTVQATENVNPGTNTNCFSQRIVKNGEDNYNVSEKHFKTLSEDLTNSKRDYNASRENRENGRGNNYPITDPDLHNDNTIVTCKKNHDMSFLDVTRVSPTMNLDEESKKLNTKANTESFETTKDRTQVEEIQNVNIEQISGDMDIAVAKLSDCMEETSSEILIPGNLTIGSADTFDQKLSLKKELFSPWIQKLILRSEGKCGDNFVSHIDRDNGENSLEAQINENMPNHDFVTNETYETKSSSINMTNPDSKKCLMIEERRKEKIEDDACLGIYFSSDNPNEKKLDECSINDVTIGADSGIFALESDASFAENINNETETDLSLHLLQVTCGDDIGCEEDSIEKSLNRIHGDSPSPIAQLATECTSKKRRLKRSFSDSELHTYNNEEPENMPQRSKKFRNNKAFLNVFDIQNNRRNSISSVYNEENMSFCILIDNNCIITEGNEEDEKICYDISEECLQTIDSESVSGADMEEADKIIVCPEENACEYVEPLVLEFSDVKSFEESWVDDVACVETVVSDDVAEDITISAPSSPRDDENSDELNIFNNTCEHTEKLRHIYGNKMCNDDAEFVETLYRTPQMDVNKTLIDREPSVTKDSETYEKDPLEDVIPESIFYDKPEATVNDYEEPAESIYASQTPPSVTEPCSQNTDDDAKDNAVDACESSIDGDDVFLLEHEKEPMNYTAFSSPEVSSTTTEEKNLTILLKITNYKGTRVSHLSDVNINKTNNSCRFTENVNYASYHSNSTEPRPLITKAAQKYIPPSKVDIHDLKVKLPLPPHSLMKFKELKTSRNKRHCKSTIPKKDIPKKPKPRFEDVLKSIDEIQFKLHKEKSKKPKKSVPKVVIKKNENGSHYASTPVKESFNPDLTGRKWQPWVFIEKNIFIDKMAVRNKTKAIYNHRKNTYVFADKFKKYKSIPSAKFVITQPNPSDLPAGQFKYTIRLKKNSY